MAAGLVVKIVSDGLLTHLFGAVGAPISTVLFHATVVCFNFYFVLRYTVARPKFVSVFFRPFVAALVSAGGAIFFYRIFHRYVFGVTLSTIVAVLGAMLVYLIAVFLFGCIDREDLLMLPKGKKIGDFLHRIHLMR